MIKYTGIEKSDRIMWRSRRPSSASAKKVRYDAFLARHEGLREALMHNHRISQDLDAKLMSFGSISEAQIALAFKLHADAYCPARPQETNVTAPVGRQTVRGTVIKLADHESQFGVTLKMTVKVTTDAGTWLCWGTVPAAVDGMDRYNESIKGREIEFKATLVRGREAHFALFKRPTNARLIEEAPADVAVAS